jgi:glutamate--cysteine ligase
MLADHLRQHVFPAPQPPGYARRIGAEVEVIPVDARSGRPLPLVSHDGFSTRSTLEILRRAGADAGWCERRSAKANVPEVLLPDGGRITFEPGGQIEISSAPSVTLSCRVARLQDTITTIADATPPDVELLSLGIDPRTPVDEVIPQLEAERYRRMLRHFDRIGPSGARMMRQTASFQVCVDGGETPELTWKVLNALAPYMVATFASSPRYEGRETGHRSYRAHVWRTLDPRRTGLLGLGDDAIDEYLRFALHAPAFLMPDAQDSMVPFSESLARGEASMSDWCVHLSTLFPEVRPRGYFELRSADVVSPQWYAVPLVFVAGLVYHRPNLDAALDLLGAPDPDLLVRGGREGLTDSVLGATAPMLCDMALEGCAALGGDFVGPPDRARAAENFDRYTRRALAGGRLRESRQPCQRTGRLIAFRAYGSPKLRMTTLIARAPTRLDFGGGWTDVPPYSQEEGGFVCNVAIARYATIRLREAEAGESVVDTRRAADSALAEAAVRRAGLRGISVEISSDFPLGAGLGGSSAAGVAVNGALTTWRGASLDRGALAEQSRAIEVEDLGVPGGRQDHYAAAYGGALALTFGDDTRVRRLSVSQTCKEALERRCIVVYTGQSRISGDTITAVLDAYRNRDRRVLHAPHA